MISYYLIWSLESEFPKCPQNVLYFILKKIKDQIQGDSLYIPDFYDLSGFILIRFMLHFWQE